MRKESFKKLLTLVVAAGVVGFAPVAQAQDEPEAPKNLEEAMDMISGSLKMLRRLSREDDHWNKCAAKVAEGSQAVIAAMNMVPKSIKAMPDGAAKRKALADTRRLMGLTLAAFGELEMAYLAEDEEKIDEVMDKLKEIKAESHERYNKE